MCITNEEEYLEQLKEYQEEVVEAEKQYEHEMAVYHQAEEAVAMLEPPLQDAKETLKALYKIDCVYPKYHNLVAICSFYEYFLSGRCTELTGPNGAYNLYEAELRQNLIINKLDNIANQLEQIKTNQYALYMELSAARKVTEGISADINGILSETISISQASNITAACAEATAKNTEALKYISLINGAQN